MCVRHSTSPPGTGTLPPLRPVPAPRVTTGRPASPANRRRAAISAAVVGKTTAAGICW